FQDTIRDSWMTAQGIAHHRREVLRLRLGLKGSKLPRLPWEVLYAGNRAIATGTDLVFSRYYPTLTHTVLPLQLPGVTSHQRQNRATTAPTLKILMVIAAPTDQENLALKREGLQLQQELQSQSGNGEGASATPRMQLTLLEQPDRSQLTQALEQGEYQVLHYAGHSNLAATGGNLFLVSRRTGLTETLSGDDLAGLLVNNGIRMVVFNSCRGAYTATSEANDEGQERNLAEALVRRGVPGVLAMAGRIPDEVALTLTQLFYRNLKQGYPVDLSLSRARQGLVSAYGSHQLYWALPILYLHAEFDGYLIATGTPVAELGAEPVQARSHPTQHPNPESDRWLQNALHPTGQPAVEEPLNLNQGDQAFNGASALETPFATEAIDQAEVLSSWNQLAKLAEEPLPDDNDDDLTDLIDDLEYEEVTSYQQDTSVANLIHQLSSLDTNTDSTQEDRPVATTQANQTPPVDKARADSIRPPVISSKSSLDLPKSPIYRPPTVAADADSNPDTPHLHSFNNASWKVQKFSQVRCVSYSDWVAGIYKHVDLAAILRDRASYQATYQPSHPATPPPRPSRDFSVVADTVPRRAPTTTDTAAIADRSTADPAPSSSSVASVPRPVPVEPRPSNLRTSRPPTKKIPFIFPVLAGAATTTLVLLIGWFWPEFLGMVRPPTFQSQTPTSSPSPVIKSSTPTTTPVASTPAPNVSTSVTAAAIGYFNQGALAQGQQAVEQLLDQGALKEATTVLASIYPARENDPIVNFLKGRLAFQLFQAGDPASSAYDAQRYFEQAVQVEPNSPRYTNPLGFAAYTAGNTARANQVWFRTLYLLGDQSGATSEAGTNKSDEILMAQAGLALALRELAQQQPTENQSDLLSQAVELRDKILREKPQAFQPEVLSKNWMWSQKTVEDWKSLLALPSQPGS
ncbi:MAG: CHAT domain-containing protein, partial [Leptolyngbyaceae bacterium]|nr:CHAT domain-containing protein [Leptolyngbyaceae bacterium]